MQKVEPGQPHTETFEVSQVVLIIDDDPLALELLSAAVRRSWPQAEPISASDGASALKRLDECRMRLRLIVTDIYMPDRDGIELLKDLALRRVTCPVMIASGAPAYILTSAKALAEASGLNVMAVLKKPVDLAAFSQLLNGVRADDRQG